MSTGSYRELPGAEENHESTARTIARAPHWFVSVIFPRLQKFEGRALRIATMIVGLMMIMVAGLVVFDRMESREASSSLVSFSSAGATEYTSGQGLCEVNTTSDALLSNMGSRPVAPVYLVTTEGHLESVDQISLDFNTSAPPMVKWASFWAPLLQGQPHITVLFWGDACARYFAHATDASANGTYPVKHLGHATTIEVCGSLAFRKGFTAFALSEYSQCVGFSNRSFGDVRLCDTHTLVGLGSVAGSVGATPLVHLATGSIDTYREIWGPIARYAPALGLQAPSLDDALEMRKTESVRCQVRFSAPFVLFMQTIWHETSKLGYNFPCSLPGAPCHEYDCFGIQQTPPCSAFENFTCGGHEEQILSVKNVKRMSVVAALIAGLSMSHNFEIVASGMVVLGFVFCCLTRQQRKEMQLGLIELAGIVHQVHTRDLQTRLDEVEQKLGELEQK